MENKDRLAISAITYAELRFGATGKKPSQRHSVIVDRFMDCIHGVLPWDKDAVDTTTVIKQHLATHGTPIVPNDAAIAGHAVSVDCVLVTNNTREFHRVPNLHVEDWTIEGYHN